MTSSEIERISFDTNAVSAWSQLDKRRNNWPVVYVLDGDKSEIAGTRDLRGDVYVGETRSALVRLSQHLKNAEKQHLSTARVIVDETFNKSVCLDLESFLIRLLAGDGAYRVLNRNDGIIEADYFDRATYQKQFEEIFHQLQLDGMFTRSIPEIQNSDLFKLSPFKSLTFDQGVAVQAIVEGLFQDLEAGTTSTTVIQGEPGTGKTVVAIFMLKLLADIAKGAAPEEIDGDSMFADFFVEGFSELLTDFTLGIVVPQQSLRTSIKKVFRRTPGLHPNMVMSAFDVGESADRFDLLIVDEAHRLNQRANQPSGVQNKKFADITIDLFGFDDTSKTQLDWITAKSNHQIFLVDGAQSVRPADLPTAALEELSAAAHSTHRHHRLASQMRVAAGDNFVGYIREVLSPRLDRGERPVPRVFEGYDLRMFDDVEEMRQEILARDAETGLARVAAGYAWPWKTKKDKTAYDIEIDGHCYRWNSTQVDWVASAKSLEEIGSIHTLQGYDLNYAGVIIGQDLRFDPDAGRLFFDRALYFDVKGKENNKTLGRKYADDELLTYICNIYAVLLTRGIRGTYVYVCDPPLREYLRTYIPTTPNG